MCLFIINLGIIHFAGITHGDAQFLCKYPLLHPSLFPAVLPLYLSAIYTALRSCPLIQDLYPNVTTLCNEAIHSTMNHFRGHGMVPQYDTVNEKFSWPIKGF